MVKFSNTTEGLNRYKLPPEHLETVVETIEKTCPTSAVKTVAENWGNCSLGQFEQAKVAWKLCHIVGTPNIKNFKAALQSNQTQNCPVTERDADSVEKIFGPDVTVPKGKLMQNAPNQRTDYIMSVLRKIMRIHSNIQMYANVIHTNKARFPTTIGSPVCHQKTVCLENQEGKTMHEIPDKTFQTCNSSSYQVKNTTCGNCFEKLMDNVKDQLDNTMECTHL